MSWNNIRVRGILETMGLIKYIMENASDAFRVLFIVLMLWQHRTAHDTQTPSLVFVYVFEQ